MPGLAIYLIARAASKYISVCRDKISIRKKVANILLDNGWSHENITYILFLTYSTCTSTFDLFKNNVHVVGRITVPNNILRYLSKGSKFIAKPRQLTYSELEISLSKFVRSIKLKYYFNIMLQQPETILPPLYVKSTSTSAPQTSLDTGLDTFKTSVLTQFKIMPPVFCHSNLTRSDLLARAFLSTNSHLMVVPTDKNLGWAVIDKALYRYLTLAHLSDTTTYQRTIIPPLDPYIHTIISGILGLDRFLPNGTNSLSHASRRVTQSLKDFSTPSIYGLLKLHKCTPRQIASGQVPIRPIIPMCYHRLSGLHQFVAAATRHWTCMLEHILLNTNDLILSIQDLVLGWLRVGDYWGHHGSI